MNPLHRDTDRFSRLASVSRALDFGPAARAHAFALPGLRQNRAHVSSEHVATAPGLRGCAVRCWRRVHRLALFHTDQLTLPLKSKTFLALFRNSVIR